MPQNVQRGMVRNDERHFQRQITTLLANPRIGPLSAATIANNLGVDTGRIFGALDALIRAGRLVRVSPDPYTAPPVVDGEPLQPGCRLAPGATPLSIPDDLRGDWLLVREDTEIAKHAKTREGREEGESNSQGGNGGNGGESAGEERGTAQDTEGERRKRGAGRDVADGSGTGNADGRGT